MKNILLPIILIFTFVQGNSQSIQRIDELGNPIEKQTKDSEFIPGEIIVKFKNNSLNSDLLESNALAFTCSQAQKANITHQKSTSFFFHFSNNKMRKVVPKYKPSYGKSISRSGTQSTGFDFQNLLVLEVDESSDIKSLCNQIEAFDEIEYAEPNHILTTHDSPPNDARYVFQEVFHEDWKVRHKF